MYTVYNNKSTVHLETTHRTSKLVARVKISYVHAHTLGKGAPLTNSCCMQLKTNIEEWVKQQLYMSDSTTMIWEFRPEYQAGVTGLSGGDISKQGTTTHAPQTADTGGRSSCEWELERQ